VITLDTIEAVLKSVKSTNIDILSDETCFIVHWECEGHVVRMLKDVADVCFQGRMCDCYAIGRS
jgi:hypothetical protein